MKRYINPLILSGIVLLVAILGFVQIQTVESQAGVPWLATFYSNPDFTGSSTTVTYPDGLSQNWGAGPPTYPQSTNPATPTSPITNVLVPGIPVNNFSARFTSSPTIAGGLYEFVVVADGGVRLSVNGDSLIDDLANTGLKTYSIITNLSGGASFILLDYIEYTGNALIQINWLTSNGTQTAGSTATPAVVGEVVQVRGLSLRSGPFLGATMLAIARPGTIYPVIAQNRDEGLFTWYQIQYNVDTIGWVSGRYLAITGDTDNLPLAPVNEFSTVYNPPGLVTAVTRSNMNFRVFPSERVLRIDAVPQLPWGAIVEILARTRQGGQDFWYMVRYTTENNNSYVGWIFAPFVDVLPGSDPIDTVPRV